MPRRLWPLLAACGQVWRDYWFLGVLSVQLGLDVLYSAAFGVVEKPNLARDGLLYFVLRLIPIWLPGIFSVALFWVNWRRASELRRWLRVVGVPVAARAVSLEVHSSPVASRGKSPRDGTYWQVLATYEYQARGQTLMAELETPYTFQEGDLFRLAGARWHAQRQAEQLLAARQPQPLLYHPANPRLVVLDDVQAGKTAALAFFLVFVVPPLLLFLLRLWL